MTRESYNHPAVRLLLILLSCFVAGWVLFGVQAEDSAPAKKTRSFHMGFTPFPYDASLEAQKKTFEIVRNHSDLIAHHFDSGVPWQEALDGDPYPPNVELTIEFRQQEMSEDHTVYLAVTPISGLRDGLAGYWRENGDTSLPPKWESRSFDHPEVIRAYLNHCRRMIEELKPDYFAYGIEVDLFYSIRPELLDSFETLAKRTYRDLKKEYPDLPVFLTFTAGPAQQIEDRRVAFERLLPYSDMMAISTYPYLLESIEGNPRNIDKEWFSRMAELAPGKPFAVAETGYTAETIMFDSAGVTISGSKAWQRRYAKLLFKQAYKLDAEFITWFVPIDYDSLWELLASQGAPEVFKSWRDSGLFDENLKKRPALKLWDKWLKRSLEQ